MRKVRVVEPSTTVQVVVNGPAGAAGAATGAAAVTGLSGFASALSGRLIRALPESRRMPSLSAMSLPGTIAEATRKMFSSVTGRPRSLSAASAGPRLSGAASSGSPVNGSRPNCCAAIFTTSASGGMGGLPKYPSTERP